MTDAVAPAATPAATLDRERLRAVAFLAPTALFLLAAFVIPLVLLLGVSARGPEGLSFDAYARLLGDDYYRRVIWNSLRLGLAHDHLHAGDRLSRRIRFGAGARPVAQRAVEQSVPAAGGERDRQGVRLDHSAAQRRRREPHPAGDRPRPRADPHDLHRDGADRRLGEYFPAVHDPADLRRRDPDSTRDFPRPPRRSARAPVAAFLGSSRRSPCQA